MTRVIDVEAEAGDDGITKLIYWFQSEGIGCWCKIFDLDELGFAEVQRLVNEELDDE